MGVQPISGLLSGELPSLVVDLATGMWVLFIETSSADKDLLCGWAWNSSCALECAH